MRDYLEIIRRNLFAPIVIAFLILAAILLILNETRDAWFVSVVITVNTLIAIIQEIRAKRALNRLELMSAPHARRIKADGGTDDVLFNELMPGDEVNLQVGDEVPADGAVTSCDGLEINESILTGESASIDKPVGSTIYAASSVVAGNAIMKISAVGAATRAGSMTAELKRYRQELTPLQKAISLAITTLTYGALGLAVLILVTYSLSGEDPVRIFKTITTAAATVVPEGLLLASSLLLAFGSLKLAQAKVLPQKLAAIEAMALLDVLCIDKTGTLTSDDIKFEKLELLGENDQPVSDLTAIVAKETSASSATGKAVLEGLRIPKGYKVIENLAFSSARKLSGVRVKYDGKSHSVILGAPEFVGKLAPLSPSDRRRVDLLAAEGKRVMLVATFPKTGISLKKLSGKSGRPVGLVVLTNELRAGVERSVKYLQDNGVLLKVISGDSPNTVRYVASQAGVLNHQAVLTGDDLAGINDDDWDKTVSSVSIFARVLPEQKEKLIDTFKRLGNYTGMVGDGVNDALALKKADLGVAMYSGAIATRRVADIVLLDNSFNSLPLGMRLGNKIIQAIELIASLFFHKIIFGVVLLATTLLAGVVYPFEPRHITFMNIFLVTLPTLVWTLSPPVPKRRLSPRTFWRDTLIAISPIALLSGLMIALAYIILGDLHPNDPMGVKTTVVIIATFFGVYLVFLVPRMFEVRNTRRTRLARLLYILTVILVIIPSFGLSFARDFFDFTMPAWRDTWSILAVIICTAIAQWILADRAGRRFRRLNHRD